MAQFSGAVKLADLNDYLGPSQHCVKPLMKDKEDDKAAGAAKTNQGPTVRIEMEVDVRAPARGSPAVLASSSTPSLSISSSPSAPAGSHFAQMRVDKEKKTATVSLNDCLACSGCVTSAEAVLIQQQSLAQFQQVLAELREPHSSPSASAQPAPSHIVVSLSPQSRASLAQHFSLSPLEVAAKLTTLLHSLGVKELMDASCTLDFSLMEAQREFVHHYRATRQPSSSISPPPPASSSPSAFPLPLLASECPGWVCYAEKTQGAYILPHMSKVKSPQQVMGTLLKQWWSAQQGVTPSSVYHLSVQPCFDKKLEGSRDEFFDHRWGVRDVDLVLSTSELLQLIQDHCTATAQPFPSLPSAPLSSTFNPPLRTSDSASSGGYAEHVFRFAAQELFGVPYSPGLLQWTQPQLRSTDWKELSLEVDGRRVLHFALLYGFRHLQTLVKAMKQGKATWDYVEVMACPSGCVNGGGQVKIDSRELRKQKELVRQVGELYRGPQGRGKGDQDERKEGAADGTRAVGDSELVREVYGQWLKAGVGSDEARERFHTSFRAIEPSDINPLTIGW